MEKNRAQATAAFGAWLSGLLERLATGTYEPEGQTPEPPQSAHPECNFVDDDYELGQNQERRVIEAALRNSP